MAKRESRSKKAKAQAEVRKFVGEFLRHVMDIENMRTVKELSIRVKMDPSYLNRILSGKHNLSLDTLVSLMTTLEYTLSLAALPDNPRGEVFMDLGD